MKATPSTPMSPSAAWQEMIEPDEQDLFERFARSFVMPRQKEVAQRTGVPAQRCLHYKTHVGLSAEFRILPDLPDYARFGVFREPRVLPAVVRFSNGESFNKADQKPQPRGIAIKVVGVPGPKLLEGHTDAVTQDFLATSHSVTSTIRHVRQFMVFIESAVQAENSRMPLPLIVARRLGVVETCRIFLALGRDMLTKVRSLATEQYVSPAPIKLGPYAVRYIVRPSADVKPASTRASTDDFLREEFAERLRDGDVTFDFAVQFYVDDRLTPIEDTAAPWKVADAPHVPVARLRIPRCDLNTPHSQALSEAIERMSFTPWHATEDHRPLGNVMRARKVAYAASSDFRGHVPEPTRLPPL